MSASSSSTPDPAAPVRLTIIGAAELETLRANNRILRSNNISIMKLKNEADAKLEVAEERVEKLEDRVEGLERELMKGKTGSEREGRSEITGEEMRKR